MNLRRALSAGLFDAGASSAATFVVGVLAVRYLDTAALGAYALFFNGYALAAIIPAQGVLQPLEIAALTRRGTERLRPVGRNLGLAAVPAGLSAAGAAAITLLVLPSLDRTTAVALASTALLCALLSPLQDHTRRMLHLAAMPWAAAKVSATHLIATLLTAPVLLVTLDVAWVPLGTLAVANAVSLVYGMAAARRAATGGRPDAVPRAATLRRGGWLLLSGMLPTGGGFLVAAFITRLASVEALGFAEAARIVAQPLLVLAIGLSAVVGPRSMEAGAQADRATARRHSRLFTALVVVGGVVYLLAAGFEAPWNLIEPLFPTAYAIPGLVAVTVVANLFNSVVFPFRSELMGGDRMRSLAGIEVVAFVLRAGVAATAGVTGAFAKPLAFLLLGVVRTVGFVRSASTLYTEDTVGFPAVDAGVGAVHPDRSDRAR